ncbi:cytochrome b subunit of succinate dehydrogenase, Sdh3p [Maudiozyma exigua]|uniref:Cytochrome b subunit of succinate dehydrogenase, Sdh3p n=1 Tax=Maudiozyma exigua TaxID=34358 RepID=A0A9P6WAA0_MAUEX|nr:cytochrome b subunit of succinate dehydrogenase, Sdh3p [Kazachstania exigua]
MLVKLGLNKAIPAVTKRSSTLSLLGKSSFVITRSFSQRTFLQKEKPYIKIDSLEAGESELLINQRKHRPISPHLTIYQPQLTWYLSSVHRVSLILLGGIFYSLTILIGGASLLGFGSSINTETITNWYHNTRSNLTKIGTKITLSYLFAMHLALSVRHMIWDAAKELTLKGVYRTGYAALGFGAIVGTYLLSL